VNFSCRKVAADRQLTEKHIKRTKKNFFTIQPQYFLILAFSLVTQNIPFLVKRKKTKGI
jgi:hypothetical protein